MRTCICIMPLAIPRKICGDTKLVLEYWERTINISFLEANFLLSFSSFPNSCIKTVEQSTQLDIIPGSVTPIPPVLSCASLWPETDRKHPDQTRESRRRTKNRCSDCISRATSCSSPSQSLDMCPSRFLSDWLGQTCRKCQ